MGSVAGLLAGLGMLLIWRSRLPEQRSVQGGLAGRRRQLLHEAGVAQVGSRRLLLAQLGCAACCAVAVLAVTPTMSVAGCFGVLGYGALPLLLRRQRRLRLRATREFWPDVIDDLASAIRAGMSLPDAVTVQAASAPVGLRSAFSHFTARYRATGQFDRSLDALKDELSDPTADLVCETLRIAREVGGTDVGSVLRSLAEMLRADSRTRAELETRQGWTVNAARLAVAAPWLVLLLLASQSSALKAFDTPGGVVVLLGGAGVCVLAYWLMLRMGRLPEPKRVLL